MVTFSQQRHGAIKQDLNGIVVEERVGKEINRAEYGPGKIIDTSISKWLKTW